MGEDEISVSERILIIDCGSQLTQNIARRVREKNVFCEIIPYKKINTYDFSSTKGIIISGGPMSVHDENSPKVTSDIFEKKIPVLGICYGMQLTSFLLGGNVEKQEKREYGKTTIDVEKESRLFKGIKDSFTAWMSHGDALEKVPEGFEIIARSNTHLASIENREKDIYAVQFHPESDHTENGRLILENFLNICSCSRDWKMSSFIEEEIGKIKDVVKDRVVIGGVSGGVDSTTASVLLAKALGKRFIPIFINNGLLRKDEEKEVRHSFEKRGINLDYVDASEEFLSKLKGIADPEEKRKIIGHTFIEVFEREAKKMDADFLMQGTLYPDVVESVPVYGSSDKIKSHHNVGGLPEKLGLKLIEPFRMLFKDEVRKIAEELDLPKELYGRHPFPGPGLAVRIIGEIDEEKLSILRKADSIFIEELRKNNIYDDIWQALAALLPLRSVGVMGDKKSYEYIAALRAVTSRDGMTADWYRMDQDMLGVISNRIMNEVKGINRVLYDVSSKPPATIEYE